MENVRRIWFFRDEKHLLWTILLLAFILRLGLVLLLDPNRYYFSDTRHYDRAALNLLAGEGFGEKYHRAPGYPIFMSGIYRLTGHSFLAVRIVEALLGVFLCFLVYRIGRTAFNSRIALWGCFIAAWFPHFLLLVGLLYPTHLFTIFLALSIYALLQSGHRAPIAFAGISALGAVLAVLTIPSMIFMLPFWMIWLVWKGDKSNWMRAIVFVLVFLAGLVPWTVRNYHHYGRLTLVQPLPHTVLPNLQDHTAQEQEVQSGFQSTVQYLRDHPTGTNQDAIASTMLHYVQNPLGTLRHLGSEALHFWALYPDRLDTSKPSYRQSIHEKDARMETRGGSFWQWVKIGSISVMAPVFMLAFWGMIIALKQRNGGAVLLLVSMLGFTLGYSLIYAEVRYRIPVEPFLILFMAQGLDDLIRKRYEAYAAIR